MGIIDARYQSTYDAMATVAYPTSGQWWTWSQAVGHQTNEIWALTPPPAAQAYQDNLVEMLRPLSRAMGAYADGDYAYGDSLWSEYRALYRVGTTHLDRANGECASPS